MMIIIIFVCEENALMGPTHGGVYRFSSQNSLISHPHWSDEEAVGLGFTFYSSAEILEQSEREKVFLFYFFGVFISLAERGSLQHFMAASVQLVVSRHFPLHFPWLSEAFFTVV